MDTVAVGTLIGRRLDRLRSGAPPTAGANTDAWRSSQHDQARALAEAMGGTAVHSDLGSVVVLETSFEMPIAIDQLAALPYHVDPRAPLVCLDLETTGLATAAGTLAFLVGVGIWQEGSLRLRQLLLPDHSSERALLEVLGSMLPADGWLVTYNGKGFDWPLLTARFRLHRRDPPPFAGHLDLLPVARQLWKHRLEGARLAIVEQALCGVERADDLPGYLIPERYFAYLRTRRAGLLRQIVEHNRQDIVSLVSLLAVLAEQVADPCAWPASHPGDLFGLARAYARRRRPAEALTVLEAGLSADAWSRGVEAGAQLHRRMSAERARLFARLGRKAEAQAAWLEICRRGGPGAGLAWLNVARYREHAERDISGALDACQQAAAIAERARAWGEPLLGVERDLVRRLPRLRRLAFRRRPFNRGVRRAA
ncbi:MAG: ribonuclease H-like domain-containing protein [Candidatus Limnocylindrales bacterium]